MLYGSPFSLRFFVAMVLPSSFSPGEITAFRFGLNLIFGGSSNLFCFHSADLSLKLQCLFPFCAEIASSPLAFVPG